MKTTTMVAMAVIMAVFSMAMGGEVYKVGDSAGWTNIGHVDYKTWASTKVFKVGDTIVFEYNKEFHNVARVTYNDFLTCGGATPYSTYTSGYDSFPIKHPGHYFFICTIPGHCEAGQKVDIRVPVAGRHSNLPTTAPAPIQPLPFPYPPPSAPSPSPVKQQSHSSSPAMPQTPPPSHSPSPVPSQSPPPAMSQSPPPAMSQSPPPAMSQSPPPAMSQSPPPAISQSPPPEMSQSPPPATSASKSPAASSHKESPSSTPVTPSPAVAPAPAKNSAGQVVRKVNVWATVMSVFFCLI